MGVPEQACCGKGGTWANGGGPLCPGCAMCPESPSYWRRAENRENGETYRPATAAESYAKAPEPSS